jgi:hypothetical protein
MAVINGPGIRVKMLPIADVSAILPPHHRVGISQDGGFAVDNEANPWTQCLRLYDQNPIPFQVPLIPGFNRNGIPNIVFDHDSQRFCGVRGNTLINGSTVNRWVILDSGGRFYSEPAYNQFVFDTHFVNIVVPSFGRFWGIVNVGDVNTGPFTCAENDTIQQELTKCLWNDTGGLTVSMVLGENLLQVCHAQDLGGTQAVYLISIPVFSLGSAFGHVPLHDFGSAFRDVPDIGQPFATTTKILGDASNPFTDTGFGRNYTFQQSADGQIVICCVGGNQAGTQLEVATGLTDYSGTTNPPVMDVNIGGQAYTPVHPLSFTLGGNPHDLSGGGALRAMSIVGGMLMSIVSYESPTPAHILFVSGLSIPFSTLTMYRYDTLNWKRSLLYGEGAG